LPGSRCCGDDGLLGPPITAEIAKDIVIDITILIAKAIAAIAAADTSIASIEIIIAAIIEPKA
jgi:hypothetical protein